MRRSRIEYNYDIFESISSGKSFLGRLVPLDTFPSLALTLADVGNVRVDY